MNAISLSQLGPLIAAIMGPMLAFIVASMRFQHQEAVKTRELISESERETRRDLTDVRRDLADVRERLADLRERLARIEGRFNVVAPPPHDETGEAGGSGPVAA